MGLRQQLYRVGVLHVERFARFADNLVFSPGCPLGNCLRSHVNRTETEEAFSMITKAGVPSYKIMVGLALYGRSFEMTTPGCYTEMCKCSGPAIVEEC